LAPEAERPKGGKGNLVSEKGMRKALTSRTEKGPRRAGLVMPRSCSKGSSHVARGRNRSQRKSQKKKKGKLKAQHFDDSCGATSENQMRGKIGKEGGGGYLLPQKDAGTTALHARQEEGSVISQLYLVGCRRIRESQFLKVKVRLEGFLWGKPREVSLFKKRGVLPR